MLQGTSIHLTPITLADVTDTYLSWLHDPEVMSGLATSGYTLDSLKEYVAQRLNDPQVAFFTIRSNEENIHIGNIKLEVTDEKERISDLGLLIGNKDFWGKGVGYEACKLAINYGFDKMKLRKIFLAVYENNPNAKKLYEKLGFKLKETLPKHVSVKGVLYDKYFMDLSKEDLLK